MGVSLEPLNSRNLLQTARFVRSLYVTGGFESFITNLIASLPKLIASEVTSYNEMRPAEARSRNWVAPQEANSPQQEEAWEHVMHEHPVLAHYHRTSDQHAQRLSDFVSSRQFHRMALYSEHYRLLGVEDALCIVLPGEPGVVSGLALHRGRRFSEHEKLIADALQPHLVQAYRNALAFDRAMKDLTLLDRALASADRALVVLKPGGRIRFASGLARQWMNDYFSGPVSGERLPEKLALWVRHCQAAMEGPEPAPPREPLVIERGDRRLRIRLMADAGDLVLLCEEQSLTLKPSSLAALRLTGREAQVLEQAAAGGNLQRIASSLGISARTVQTHLQSIYSKLKVESRSAAVAMAFQLDRAAGPHIRPENPPAEPAAKPAPRPGVARAKGRAGTEAQSRDVGRA
jgi:DNA-binding CsgD family transcriptional regulator